MASDQEKIDEIIGFWFGEIKDGFTAEDMSWLWWAGGPDIDQNIQERFGEWVEKAALGELAHWVDSPRGRLAHIILLDQFTRNIYRKTAKAFAADPLALKLTLEGIESKHDLELEPIQRIFMYMPLEHAEDLEMQDLCANKFREAMAPYLDDPDSPAQNYLKASQDHRAIIEQFGRFPHRNAVLGRESTEAEIAYLNGDHKSFGQ